MRALVGTFNQEKALVGVFSVIVKTGCETDRLLYSTNQDCGELGCQFASVMETNISRLENIFDTKYVSKINKDTLSQAVISSFSDLDTQIPANGTMESPLNITLETVKDDIGKKDPDGGTRCQECPEKAAC